MRASRLTTAVVSLTFLLGGLAAAPATAAPESQGRAPAVEVELPVVDPSDLPSDGGWVSEIPEEARLVSQNELLGIEPTVEGSQQDAATSPGVSLRGAGGVVTAGKCKYQQVTDDPHKTSKNKEVSVHGWWTVYSGTCPADANVDTYLQAMWCGSNGACGWVTVGSNSLQIKPGGGSGKRVSARLTCATQTNTLFRGLADVDLPGIIDPSGMQISPQKNLTCSPPGPHT